MRDKREKRKRMQKKVNVIGAGLARMRMCIAAA